MLHHKQFESICSVLLDWPSRLFFVLLRFPLVILNQSVKQGFASQKIPGLQKFGFMLGFLLLLFFFSLVFPKSAMAATLYWVGADGANASVASNWKTTNPTTCGGGDSASAPATGDTINFDADCDNSASWDSSAASQITILNLNSGYAGTVTLARSLIVSSTMTEAAGTFTAAAQTFEVDGTFTLSAGTFTASSGTTTFKGSITISGTPTFNHNSGTVAFVPTNTRIYACNNATFNAVTMNTNNNVTVNADCSIPLGANPTTSGTNGTTITLKGTLSGTGTLTMGTSAGNSLTLDGSSATLSGFSGLSFPSSSDILTLSNSASFNASSYSPLTLFSLIINSGTTFIAPSGTMTIAGATFTTSGTFTHNSGTINFTKNSTVTVTCGSDALNAVTLNNASLSWKIASACTVGSLTLTAGTIANPTAPQTLSVTGDFAQNANTTFGGANLTVSFTGSGTQNISKTTGTFSSIFNVNNSGTAKLTTALTVTGQACTVTGGTFYLAGQVFTCSTGFTVSSGATLQLQGAETPTTPTLNSGSTVKYVGDGDSGSDSYTLANYSYSNLTIASTDGTADTFRLANNFTPATVVFSAGTINTNGATTFNPSGLLTISGASWSPGSLSISAASGITCSSGTLSASSATIAVTGTLTLSGCTTTAPSGTMTVTGNFAHSSGSFTANGGTVSLTGTSQQVTGSTTFYNLSKVITTPADTLTFGAAATQTITNTTTLTGTNNNLLTLASSSPGTQWIFDPQGSRSISYVSVSYSNNTNGSQIVTAGNNITDGGNNTGWLFNQDPTVPTSLGPTALVNGSFGASNQPQVTFTLADPDAGNTVKYHIQIDGHSDFSAPVVDYTSALAAQGSFNFTVGQSAGSGSYTTGTSDQTLADGSYYWRVLTIDSAAAQSSYSTANSGAIAFKIDATAPSSGSITYTDGYYTATSVALTVSDGTDSGSGIDTSIRTVQRKSATLSAGSCGSYGAFGTISTTGTYPNLTDSSVSSNTCYQYRYLVSDLVGNQATYTSSNVAKIDTTSPASGSITYTDGYYTATSVALTVSDGTDSGSGIDSSTRTVKRKSATLTAGSCGSYSSFSTISTTGSYPNLTDTSVASGSCYIYEYLVSDLASNQTTYTSSNAVKVDAVAPTTPGTPSTTTPTSSSSQTWVWTAATDALSGIASYAWRVVDPSNNPIVNGTTSALSVVTNLTQGIYSFFVKAIDNATNNGSESSGSVTVNTNAPTGSISINSGASYTTSPSVVLTLSATDDTDSASSLQMEVSNAPDFIGISYESYATSKSWTLATGDGSKTVYVRFKDSAGNVSSTYNTVIVLDGTNPVSLDLDSPGENSYTNDERPSFRWNATTDTTAGLSKYVLEIDNGETGDFTIDSIPVSRISDLETNKYTIHYENFDDSDSTNNYISLTTKSSPDWGSGNNDGKLKEGKVRWKVKAVDNAGNETSSSGDLFVDRTAPSLTVAQINDASFSNNNFSTTVKTPTIYGKITDILTGGDSTRAQDENGPKIASGPKQLEIKVEKKEGLSYRLITLYTINMVTPWYDCDDKEVSDNSKQKCNKYLPFEYIQKEALDNGIYKITLTGKDEADNSSSTSLILTITTYAKITTPKEKKAVEETLLQTQGKKPLTPEEKEKIQESLEITRPTELPKPSAFDKAGQGIIKVLSATVGGVKQFIGTVFSGMGHIAAFYPNIIEKELGLAGLRVGTIIDSGLNAGGTVMGKVASVFVSEPTRISGVKVAKSTPNSMTITWETNNPANGKVNYGLTADYGQDIQTDKKTTKHEFTVTKLKSGTMYFYEVMSQGKNYVYDANHTFRTPEE